MMNFCGLMVANHLQFDNSEQDNPYRLNREDYFAATEKLDKRLGYQITGESENVGEVPNLIALIQNGETEKVEFKARLFISNQELQPILHDPKLSANEKKNIRKRPELTKQSVIKAIAGMFNSEGGILFIGVTDDGQILGIEQDIENIKGKKGTDGFALNLSRLVETYLGLGNLRFIKVRFPVLIDKTICLILIEKTPWPVYLLNRSSNQSEFYIRGPNSTRKLDAKQTVEYIKRRK